MPTKRKDFGTGLPKIGAPPGSVLLESVAWGKVPGTQREHVLSVFVVPETVKSFFVFHLITPLHPPQELGLTFATPAKA